MKILDYVTKEELQGMQEKYARACNVSVMVEDIAGKAVTKGAGRAEEGKTKFNENVVVGNERIGRVVIGQLDGIAKEDDDLQAAAVFFSIAVANYVEVKRMGSIEKAINEVVKPEMEMAENSVNNITGRAKKLEEIASRQNILTLNASIEAARAGSAGSGFAVVAHQMGDMSKSSGLIYNEIEKDAHELKGIISKINDVLNDKNQEQ
ncbi:MAG: hypothetical protein K5894_06050 [Lachnospiraceae bacterium]|nr:hypothetical protein [Lachnospiraceae bacterium]